jgi:hypothetical protein
MRAISKDDEIEFIFKNIPDSLLYLMKKGVCGLNCGQPVWGTLANAAKERGFSAVEIDMIVDDLNSLISPMLKQAV